MSCLWVLIWEAGWNLKVEGGVEAQARQALKNMKAVIEAGGSEVGKVVKTTVRPSFYLSTTLRWRRVPWTEADRVLYVRRCSCSPWTTSSR